MPRHESLSVSRRAWARMVLWGAVGLSLLPSCRGRGSATKASRPQGWAGLGQIWREMGSFRPRGEVDLRKWPALKQLRRDMEETLDAVSASPELRAAVEGRWDWINTPYAAEDELRRTRRTCYLLARIGTELSGPAIEEQVEELSALQAEGKLTKEAARKAAAALALQAEYLARDGEALRLGQDEEDRDRARHTVSSDYHAGRLKAGPGAHKAGEQLVEMTADRPGMLGGVPQSTETAEPGKEGAP